VGAPAPTHYDHVIWVVMENKSSGSVLGTRSSSGTTALASRCGVATGYRAVAHPSLPNYLALTSGTAHGVTDDAGPDQHRVAGPSLFSEVASAGRDWATYAESMPVPCARYPTASYATKHNPALYYTALYPACPSHDLPLGTTRSGPLARALAAGTVPAFSLVVPDLCNDTHDCPVAQGDAWLGQWLDVITSSRTYAAGRTAVFLTWDEDDSAHGNRVALIAVAPCIRPGTTTPAAFTHLSLLRTTEELLGLTGTLVPTASSMRAAFGM
jgi:phosphatidylinositol-3-phosphatase